jgi:hypothetical protein
MTALLMFEIGILIDSHIRNTGDNTYLACNTLKCNIVTLADDPMIFFRHPIEATKELIYSD